MFRLPRTLAVPLTALFLIVTLIPLGLLTVQLNNASRELLLTGAFDSLSNVADAKVRLIEQYLIERQQDTVNATSLSSTRQMVNAMRRARQNRAAYVQDVAVWLPSLQGLTAETSFSSAILIDLDGFVLLSTHPELASGATTADFPYDALRRVVEQVRTLLQAELSTLELTPDGVNTQLYSAAPVYIGSLLSAVLVFEVRPADVFAVLGDTAGLIEGQTLVGLRGQDGQLYGLAFNAQRRSTEVELLRGVPESLQVAAIGVHRATVEGEQVTVSRYVPSLRAGIAVQRQTSAALAAIPQQQQLAGVILLATAVIVALIAPLAAATVVQPLRQLIGYTHRIATGDLGAEIALNRRDELGELAADFSEMVAAIRARDDELRQSNALLEERVMQRTAELEQAVREALEANRLKDEFLATMSHELRTPLNAIIGFLGIMGMTANLDEKDAHRLKRTRANAERLLHLINDILDVSRLEAGRVELVPRQVDLPDLVDGLRSQMAILAEDKNLKFETYIDPDLPRHVWVDDDALQKILTNLLGNAFKFTDTGLVSLRIERAEERWRIVVRDTGVGIPIHMQQTIFERFRQADSSSTRRHGGTGLGLAIVSKLCQLMGGTVQVVSSPNKGSTFTVTLPLHVSEG